MKKLFTLLVIIVITGSVFSQSPQKMSYQAVVRNASGVLVTNQIVGLRISILRGTPTGTVVYQETYNPKPQTNTNGLLTVEIGSGTASIGTFSSIEWATGPYYLKTETDPTGGTSYTISGTSQLLSVPYALHSKTAAALTVAYPETDPVFEVHPASGVTTALIGNWNTAYSWGNHAGLYRPVSYVPAWAEVTGKPVFATVATSGNYNDLINKPAPYVAGAGIAISGSTISANLSLQVSTDGDLLTLTPGNSVYVPGISNANSPVPIVTSKAVTNITATKAYGSGNVLFYGATAITETGICWSLNQPPTVADSYVVSGVYDGDFICVLDGLTANTIYFARAYAKTAGNAYYGETVMFTTSDIIPIPTLTTTEVSGITETTALSGGYISADGGSAVTARGVCWSTSPAPTTASSKTTNGTGNGLFTSVMTGLTLNTKYYVRAYATNANGTNYGPELFFKTAGILPTVTTDVPAAVTAGTATLGGNVTAQGSTAVTDRGVCLSTSANPTISDLKVASGTGIGSFSTSNAKLKPNTSYYVRAYATNSVGTSYGQNQQLTTLDAYYESFETDFPGGSTGAWGIITGDAVEGYFFLYSNQDGAMAILTRTLLNPGQISYWSRNYHSTINTGYHSNTIFYIDDIEQTLTNSSTWLQKSFPVTAGTHTFKWVLDETSGEAWVDYIIMPK
ncbi:MAG: hypothetical protein MUO72_10505 [Bacteroidales bacterium]|nr:hypothetical protein [Bacteroidales bacterium]